MWCRVQVGDIIDDNLAGRKDVEWINTGKRGLYDGKDGRITTHKGKGERAVVVGDATKRDALAICRCQE